MKNALLNKKFFNEKKAFGLMFVLGLASFCASNLHGLDLKTAQMYDAIKEGEFDVVKAFIDEGAKVNDKDSEGNTALHYAVVQNAPHAITWLLNHGADTTAQEANGNGNGQ